MKRNILICLILFSFPANLLADTIHLKNGSKVVGAVVGQTRTSISVKTNRGTKVVRKSDIVKVKFGVTQSEKTRQAARRKEMERRRKQLALARQKQQQAQIAAEQKKLAELKTQEEKEAARLKEREKKVLSVEEEVARLTLEEKDLEKRLEEVRRKRAKLEGANPVDYLWRSAVLPGWGQMHAGDDLKGYGWMGGTLATAAYALYRYTESVALRSDFEAQQNLWNGFLLSSQSQQALGLRVIIPQAAQASLNEAERDVNTFSILSGTLYVFNLVDAYFFTGSTSILGEVDEPGYWHLSTVATGKSLQAEFTYKF